MDLWAAATPKLAHTYSVTRNPAGANRYMRAAGLLIIGAISTRLLNKGGNQLGPARTSTAEVKEPASVLDEQQRQEANSGSSRPAIDGASAREAHANDPMHEPAGGSKRRWWPDVARVTASVGVAATLLYSLAYAYLLGFYEQWHLTPEEVGIAHEEVISRVSIGVVGGWGFLIILTGALIFALRRRTHNATPQQFFMSVGVTGASIVAIVVGTFFHRNLFGPVAVLLGIGGVIIGPALLVTFGLPMTWAVTTFRRLVAQNVQNQVIVAVVATFVVVCAGLGATSLIWRMNVLGVYDGNRLINSGAADSGSWWQTVTGAHVRLGTAEWLAPSASPLKGPRDRVQLLGVNGAAMTLFDLEICKVLTVPTTSIAFSDDLGSHPAGEKRLPTQAPPPLCISNR
jgi:hypothetical protein